jgi:isopenicillin N synthase-like dioxygenase
MLIFLRFICVVLISKYNYKITAEALNTKMNNPMTIPLIELSASIYEDDATGQRMQDLSQRVVRALQTSGFLLVCSPFLPIDLQKSAIRVTKDIFRMRVVDSNNDNDGADKGIIQHPTDPKQYLMVDCHSRETIQRDISLFTNPEYIKTISEYVEALETLKMQLLECIAIGLKLPTKSFLADLHQTRNSALRLLHYSDVSRGQGPSKPISTKTDDDDEIHTTTQRSSLPNETNIRCKAHSDYGSLTLLLTDGVPGLQAFVNRQWIPVPYVEGALVVNIGSLLSEWTKGVLLATLHRVVSDLENNSDDDKTTRTSLAFFADPDPNISAKLNKTRGTAMDKLASMSVAEYIQYRSGGASSTREGVQFTVDEQARLESQKNSGGVQLQSENLAADQEEFTALWKGALEVFVHQLLYVRRVYPRDTFGASRFLGSQCHVCRHPDVVSYINEALEIVVPGLLLNGSCNEFVVEIYDQVKMTTFEEYYISFDPHMRIVAPLENVEKDLRDLICSVGTVGRVASSRWPDSVSFKILVLYTSQDSSSDTNVLQNLETKWFRAYRKNERTDDQRRTIYDVPSCGCTFQYQHLTNNNNMDTSD